MAGRRILWFLMAIGVAPVVVSAHAAQRQENAGKGGEVNPNLQPVAAQLASAAQQALRQGIVYDENFLIGHGTQVGELSAAFSSGR